MHTPGGLVPIERIRVGQRVLTFTAEERGSAAPANGPAIDRESWRLVRLVVEPGGRDAVEVTLLRGADWFAVHPVDRGDTIALELPEMGLAGEAVVCRVEPCPEIAEGEGRVVTGTFARLGRPIGLRLAGCGEMLGVTANHPVWSLDRDGWAAAGTLLKGEEVQLLDRTTTVTSLDLEYRIEAVYNLEVTDEHVYRVGLLGLLVHNASPSQGGANPPPPDTPGNTGSCPCKLGKPGSECNPPTSNKPLEPYTNFRGYTCKINAGTINDPANARIKYIVKKVRERRKIVKCEDTCEECAYNNWAGVWYMPPEPGKDKYAESQGEEGGHSEQEVLKGITGGPYLITDLFSERVPCTAKGRNSQNCTLLINRQSARQEACGCDPIRVCSFGIAQGGRAPQNVAAMWRALERAGVL